LGLFIKGRYEAYKFLDEEFLKTYGGGYNKFAIDPTVMSILTGDILRAGGMGGPEGMPAKFPFNKARIRSIVSMMRSFHPKKISEGILTKLDIKRPSAKIDASSIRKLHEDLGRGMNFEKIFSADYMTKMLQSTIDIMSNFLDIQKLLDIKVADELAKARSIAVATGEHFSALGEDIESFGKTLGRSITSQTAAMANVMDRSFKHIVTNVINNLGGNAGGNSGGSSNSGASDPNNPFIKFMSKAYAE